ncbi:MAG: zinc-dependent metalloprotease [Cryomorphaceae bacterium]|nr:zinc-dependent metalloprotease [Cryomorphaceae bacterium]
MKTFSINFVIFLSILSFSLKAQSYCDTHDTINPPLLNFPETGTDDTLIFKVYLHSIKTTSGENGHSDEIIEIAKCNLIKDYQEHNIFFDFQPINHINDTYYTWQKDTTIINAFAQSDGLNIFFTKINSIGNSFAIGIPSNSCFIRGIKTFIDTSMNTTKVIPQAITSIVSHEVGHMLGLYHTHHGTSGPWNPFPAATCAELVDGSNCDTCGDYVCDTPADRYGSVDQTHINYDCSYNWDSVYSLISIDSIYEYRAFDANGDTINPDRLNIMSFSYVHCYNSFTNGQISRIRNVVANSPLLQACLSSGSQFDVASNFDLMIKTTIDDYGQEPLYANVLWKSPDIWIRNSPDGFDNQVHQSPVYDSLNPSPVYVYVKVRNIGCQSYEESGFLKLYWAKAATALSWPSHWIDNFQNGLPMGDIIDSVPLSVIHGKDSVIYEFEWHLENPEQYTSLFSGQQPWHYCLLARIVSIEDPILMENSRIHLNVSNSNNIAWKNVYIIYPSNLSINYPGGLVNIGSIEEEDTEESYDFYFSTKEVDQHFLTEEAEVYIILDEEAWQKWDDGGRVSTNIEIYDEENRMLLITQNEASIENLVFPPQERNLMGLVFNFLTEEVTEIDTFELDVVQKYNNEDIIAGGETYVIIKDPDRILFFAEGGGDKYIDIGDSVILSGNNLNESVIYKWYENNTLISDSQSISISPNQTSLYKLEIIAEDGYKDYDSLTVFVATNYIKNISPNPANQEISVQYLVDEVNSFSISLINSSGILISNQNLSNKTGTITFGIQGLPSGTYYCQIKSGQQILDSKSFLKL